MYIYIYIYIYIYLKKEVRKRGIMFKNEIDIVS